MTSNIFRHLLTRLRQQFLPSAPKTTIDADWLARAAKGTAQFGETPPAGRPPKFDWDGAMNETPFTPELRQAIEDGYLQVMQPVHSHPYPGTYPRDCSVCSPAANSSDEATTILIKAGDQVIGDIQRLDILDRDKDGNPLEYPRAEVHRARFDREQVAKLFNNRDTVHLRSQTYPFQIEILGDPKCSGLQNCWITSTNLCYVADQWIIIDQLELEAEKSIS